MMSPSFDRARVCTRWVLAFLLIWTIAPHASAAAPALRPTPTAPVETEASDEAPPAPDSPQGVVEGFLALGDRGEFVQAAAYLDLGRLDASRGPELARRLHAVISRVASINPELLSGKSEGTLDDGLARGLERIGAITPRDGSEGDAVDVLLQRRLRGTPRWVFSRKTVENVDAWYETLDDRWLIDNLPEPLLRMTWGELAYWQWIALPVWLGVAWLLGWLLGRVTRRIVAPLIVRSAAVADDVLLRRFSGPLTLLWTLAVCRVSLPLMSLLPRAETTMREILGAALVLLVFWGALRAVDLLADLVSRSAWATARPGTRALLPLGVRILKVVVGTLAIVAVFAKLDYPIASLLAGLGIGGLAVALAAQKSFENLIGAFAIGADQPFREGDLVKVEDFTGTVETIGLRSTKFRTPDRTVVTIPNGRLADMRLETYAARDRLRMACTIGLTYGASEAQIRRVLEGIRGLLAAHTKAWPEGAGARLIGFGPSSLDIEVTAAFQTTVWDEFTAIREEVLLAMMVIVEEAGCSFAFPTRIVHLHNART